MSLCQISGAMRANLPAIACLRESPWSYDGEGPRFLGHLPSFLPSVAKACGLACRHKAPRHHPWGKDGEEEGGLQG